MSTTPTSRLSLMSAALVVARRDFFAILLSRAFLFFLFFPLFPILVGGLAGGIGSQVKSEVANPELAVLLAPAERDAIVKAHEALGAQLGGSLPPLVALDDAPTTDPKAILAEKRGNIAAVLSGSLEQPVLTGPENQLISFSVGGGASALAERLASPPSRRAPSGAPLGRISRPYRSRSPTPSRRWPK